MLSPSRLPNPRASVPAPRERVERSTVQTEECKYVEWLREGDLRCSHLQGRRTTEVPYQVRRERGPLCALRSALQPEKRFVQVR